MPFFAISPIQYIEGSHRAAGSSPAASLLPEKKKGEDRDSIEFFN
jgi:hypothetical protein